MTTHLETETLHAYVDGELTAAERRAADAHLDSCTACTEALVAVGEVAAAVRALPAEVAPSRDLWPGVADRLVSRTAPGPDTDAVVPLRAERRRRTRGRRVSFTLPQLYAAGIVLALLSGGTAWYAAGSGRSAAAPRGGAGLTVPEVRTAARVDRTPAARYDQAVEELERALREGRDLLDPETLETLEASLATVDRAIDEARDALARDPASDLLYRILENHRETRLRILEQAVAGLGRT